MPDLAVGSTIAGCRLEAIAGRGGMGVVWRATQLALNRPVALKAIAPQLAQDQAFRERFQHESLLAASLDHPNVIPVYEAGELDGTLYLIMRWVDGTDLRAMLDAHGGLTPERTIRLLRPVASALAAAHRRGLIHRDIKPANVLIATADDESDDHVYLTDFGIAQRTESRGMTRTGVLVGTLDYMAPERIEGGRGTPASDIYAFGCMLFETLTGRIPFDRPTGLAKMHAHLNDPVQVDGLPTALAAIVTRAMAKRPEDRFGSATALVAALDGVSESMASPPASPLDLPTELSAAVDADATVMSPDADATLMASGSEPKPEPTPEPEPTPKPEPEPTPEPEPEPTPEPEPDPTVMAQTPPPPSERVMPPAPAATHMPPGPAERPTPVEPTPVAPTPVAPIASPAPSAPRSRTAPTAPIAPARSRNRSLLALLGLLAVAAIVVVIVVVSGGGGGGGATTSVTARVVSGSGVAAGSAKTLPGTPLALAADGHDVWAATDDKLTQVAAGSSPQVVDQQAGPGPPSALAVDADRRLWLAGVGSSGVQKVPANSNAVETGGDTNLLALDSGVAWIGARGANTVTRASLDSLQTTSDPVSGPVAAFGVAFARLWVAAADGRVTVLDQDGGRNALPAPNVAPGTVGVVPSNGVWFVSSDGTLNRIDPRLTINGAPVTGHYVEHPVSLRIAGGASAAGAWPGTNAIWVLSPATRSLVRVGTQGTQDGKITAQITFSVEPRHLAVGDHVVWVDIPSAHSVVPITY